MPIEQKNVLSEKEAAKYLGVSSASLRLWRGSERGGPRFFRAGRKLIRYRRSDLDRWVESRLNRPQDAA